MKNMPIRKIITTEVVTVPPDTPLSDAVGLMEKNKISCLIVAEGEKPIGIFTERDLIAAIHRGEGRIKAGAGERLIRDFMSPRLITSGPEIDIYEAYSIFETNKIRHLVVLNREGGMAGLLTHTDMRDNLGVEFFVEIKNISKIMTRDVIAMAKGARLKDAIAKMAEHRISCIVVSEEDRPVGILTERDVVRIFKDDLSPKDMRVEDVMSKNPLSISLDAPVHEASKIMAERKIRRLVVLDGEGKIAGIITQSDIIRGFEGKYIEFLKGVIRKKEEELRKAKKILSEKTVLENILRSSPDLAIVAVDQDFTIMHYNPTAERFFGLHQKEALGRSVLDIHEEKGVDPLRLEAALRETRETGEYAYSCFLKSGADTRLREGTITGMTDGEGNPAGYVLMLRDVTERKKLEEEIFKAQKLESVGVLAGGIAHDFNNILTAVLGNISVAKTSGNAPQDVLLRLAEAEKAALTAKELTQKLLIFSKGGTPLKRASKVQSVIKDSCELALSGSSSRCALSAPEDLWPVEIDRGQVLQAVNNLLINADQAMPEGGIIGISCENVTIGTESPLPAGRYVKISVRDEGVGIPEEYLKKIFDPFFTTKKRGTGLGLSTAYSIVKRHGGHLDARSSPGEGSTFFIYLPASEKEPEAEEAEVKAPVSGTGRILAMDDENIVRLTLGIMLETLGYEAEFASDGKEAIEKYRLALGAGRPFDAVVLDLTVPGGMGGKDALRGLMEIDPSVKALISSGYSDETVSPKYIRHGFKGFIVKPYTIEELGHALSGLFSDG